VPPKDLLAENDLCANELARHPLKRLRDHGNAASALRVFVDRDRLRLVAAAVNDRDALEEISHVTPLWR
jgi:hypothetical protein